MYMVRFKLSTIIFILGMVLLGAAGISILFSHQGFAQKLFQISFWVIVPGTFIYFLEMKFKSEK